MLKKLGQMIFILLTLSGALFASTTTNYIQYDSAASESIKKSVSLKIGDIDYLEIGFSQNNPEEDMEVITPISNPYFLNYNTSAYCGEGEFYIYCIYGTNTLPEISISITDLALDLEGDDNVLNLSAIINEDDKNPLTAKSGKRQLFSKLETSNYKFGVQSKHISLSTESVIGKKAGIYGGTITVYIGDQG